MPVPHHRAARAPKLASVFCVLASASGCHFDLDQLYAANTDDAGVDAGLPDDLIDLFRTSFELSEACRACAVAQCADVNASCRADAKCSAFTACIAGRDTPAQREDCRARFRDWLGEPSALVARDVNGPYGSCVFLQNCATDCESHADVRCSGKYSWPTTTTGVSYRLRISDTKNTALPDVRVRVCDGLTSETCSGDTVHKSNAEGIVDLPLPTDVAGAFTGYLEINGDGLQPQLVRFAWPVARGGVLNLTVIASDLYYLIVMTSGAAVDESRGMVQVRVSGCSGVPLADASVSVTGQESDPSMRAWYTNNEIFPTFTATATNDLGAAGVINVPPGLPKATITLASTGQVLAQPLVPTRANHISTVLVVPE